jgi:2',3'-cyclic-nucleotide 2'-phosphodiesterase (5'-nucleotidase family)
MTVAIIIAAAPRRLGSRSAWVAASVLLGLLACRSAPPRVEPASRVVQLRVLATHDFHGALRPFTTFASGGRAVGGAAILKTAMDQLETSCACPTVRIDGGDQLQGSLESNLTSGVATVAAFNFLGLDAAAVGNHELDWGTDTLLARQRDARYAWLAANVFRVSDGLRPDWAKPFTTFERGGLQIGVVGYATVSTPRTLRPSISAPYVFKAGYAAIRDALDAVWRGRPDFVIVAAHAGGDCTADGCAGEMVDLASELPPGRVHLIVGGHTHAPGQGTVNGIPIIRAGSNGRALGVVDLYRDADGVHRSEVTTQALFANTWAEHPGMTDLLTPYFRAADAKGREVVAMLPEPLSASPSGDRRLGLLIAEAMRLSAPADVGLQNPGGVRADLPRGAVSYADIYRVIPFDNAVVRLTLTGRQLRRLIEQAGPRYYFSNLLIDWPGQGAPGGSVAIRFANATPLLDDRSYTLATNDFLADGGDGFAILPALPREHVGPSVLDFLIEYMRSVAETRSPRAAPVS